MPVLSTRRFGCTTGRLATGVALAVSAVAVTNVTARPAIRSNAMSANHMGRIGQDRAARFAIGGAAAQFIEPGLQTARAGHTATLLPDGRIVIAGGTNGTTSLSSIEFVDPATMTSVAAGISMPTPRHEHAGAAMPGGGVLWSQGVASSAVSSLLFAAPNDLDILPEAHFARARHTATVLMDGNVLLIGGTDVNGTSPAANEVYGAQPEPWDLGLFDPRTGAFQPYADVLRVPRADHTATTLADGRVLIVGGQNGSEDLASAEILDPSTGVSELLPGAMLVPRSAHTASLLADGTVLIVGGKSGGLPMPQIERYDPTSQTFTLLAAVLTGPRWNHSATLLPSGNVLIAGGVNAGGTTAGLELVAAPVLDAVPPSLTATQPSSGAVNVALNATLSFRFSEPVDITSVTPSSLRVTAGEVAVSGVPSTSESGLYATFVAAVPYAPATEYVVTLDGVRDTSGNPLPAVTITFTTVIRRPLPPLNLTVASSVARSAEFLYSGPDPVQTGVAEGALDRVRVSILRGKVTDREGNPLSGVHISVKDHSELGTTLSQGDGVFDLAVNGGGLLAIEYRKSGHLPVVRQIDPAWGEYAWLPPVAVTPYDAQVTSIDLSAAVSVEVARGSTTSDADGSRTATLLFEPGTTATAVMADGSTQPLTNISVRATEYTTGPTGPAAMPGPLPGSSAYTYAVDFSIDEALNVDARSVTFSKPVITYVENFLGFPVGEAVPLGSFDAEKVAWIPSPNGLIIQVLAVNGSLAELDVTGGGQAASAAELALLGIDDAEREKIASLYQPGQSLWRLPIPHFSPWDANWPFGPPQGSMPPGRPARNGGATSDIPDPECASGSIIECENQVLGENIPIVGTPFHLSYRSNRRPRPGLNHHLEGSLTGPELPAGLKRVELEIAVAGRLIQETYPAAPNQTYAFDWDGNDAYGRRLQGIVMAQVRIGYTYDGVYRRAAPGPTSFGSPGPTEITGSRTRQEITLWQALNYPLGEWDAKQQGLGGWNLSPHHAYDPSGSVLYLGSGETRSARGAIGQIVATVAGGGGGPASFPDGSPATSVSIGVAKSLQVAPDGTVFLTAGTDASTVYRLQRDGTIYTVGSFGMVGGLGPDGSVYTANPRTHRVHRILPDGTVVNLAGTGTSGYFGDGGPAAAAQLNAPWGVTVAPDGTVYIADTSNRRIRKIAVDGTISTIAGTGTYGYGGDGGPAVEALFKNPLGLAMMADGSILVADLDNYRVRRIQADGSISTFAGNGGSASGGDGGPAAQASMRPEFLSVDRAGNVYVADMNGNTLRRIGTDGLVTTVAGNGQTSTGLVGSDGYGSQAKGTAMSPSGVAVAPDGSVYIGDDSAGRVRRLASPLPDARADDILIPSTDGKDLFVFNAEGRHLRTVDAFTAGLRYAFVYNEAGFLIEILDANDNTTQVARAGVAPVAIVAPGGQRTGVITNADGYIRTLTDPEGNSYAFEYDGNGFLRELTDPRNQTHDFSYSADGRLIYDQDPGGGSSTLARSVTDTSATVTLTTGMGRQKVFRLDRLTSGFRRTFTDFSGLQRITQQGDNGTTTITTPDGVVTTSTVGADPRWGLQVAVPKSITMRMPSGLQYTGTGTRTATFSDVANPLSLQTQTDTAVINGMTFRTVFDVSTRTTTTTTPLSRQLVTRVDALGRIVSRGPSGLEPMNFTYDSKGRLATVQQGTRQFVIEYDAANRPVRFVDALSHAVLFAYDDADRLVRQTQPDGGVIDFGYNANGKVTTLVPPGKPAHAFDYTSVDLLSTYTPPTVGTSESATYFYNLDKQLTLEFHPGGQGVSLGYDNGGRLETATYSRGQIQFAYHATTGVPASLQAPDTTMSFGFDGSLPVSTTWSGGVAGTVSRTFNSDFRVTAERVNGVSEVTFQYDDDGLLRRAGDMTLTRHAQHGLVTRAGLGYTTSQWTHSTFGEVSRHLATGPSSTVFLDQQFTRDALGRIVQKTENDGILNRSFGYGYDAAGRLTSVTLNGLTPIFLYSYDNNGNRTSVLANPGSPDPPVTATFDDQDRLVQQGPTSFTYTANGNLLTRTEPSGVTRYTYDEFGNLITVLLPDGRRIDYLIDGLNRRVGKKINGVLVRGWLYGDQLRPVAELNGAGAVVSRFVYGTDLNVPDYIVKGTHTYRIIKDHLGSPRIVVSSNFDATIVQRLDYDPFGVVATDSNPAFQPFGFAGGLYDPDTKMVRFGVRDYDPSVGRWTAKDKIGFDAGDANVYGYVLNDPVNMTDPTGYIAPLIVGAAVGAGLGAVSGAAGALAQNGSLSDVLIGASVGAGIGAFGGAMGFAAAPSAVLNVIADALGQAIAAAGQCSSRPNFSSLAGAAAAGAAGAARSTLAGRLPGLAARTPLAQEAIKGLAALPATMLNVVGNAFGSSTGF